MLDKARAIQNLLSNWRRDFHAHPELGFSEIRTSDKISEIMEGFGYHLRRGVGRTGILADIGSGSPGIAIRADMDALPLQELTGAVYASQNPGVMHACGHDSHMACALGAALLLTCEDFLGRVRFIFQPSEEVSDEEGISGAPRMVADGALDGVDAIIALHVESDTPCGSIRTVSGPASGGVDSWFGAIIGRGGHGAYPHKTLDPFFLAAQVINSLNAIVSRRIYPFHPAVISIGSMHGGVTENVIPERVSITGTLRYTEKSVQEQLHAEIQRAFGITRTLGGDFELRFEIGAPPMINHPTLTEIVTNVGCDLLGSDKVLPWRQEMGAEDFGYFMDEVPGTMFALGVLGSNPSTSLHSPYFDIDENCLPIGAAIFVETALRFLPAKKL